MVGSRLLSQMLLVLVAALPRACDVDQAPDYQHLSPEAAAVLAKPDRLELFSLEPTEGEKQPTGFHDWKILGQTDIKDAQAQAAVVAALESGIAASDVVASCFAPRHGLRATQGNTTVDLVICFQCRSIKVYVGDKQSVVWTTPAPQPTLDKVLLDAKVPLAPKADGT